MDKKLLLEMHSIITHALAGYEIERCDIDLAVNGVTEQARQDLAANATLLAKQHDLRMQAETELLQAQAQIKRLEETMGGYLNNYCRGCYRGADNHCEDCRAKPMKAALAEGRETPPPIFDGSKTMEEEYEGDEY